MIKNRFFIDSPLTINAEITIQKEEQRHFKVLRVRDGETVEIVNGKGVVAKAQYLGGKILLIQDVSKEDPPKHQSTIIQAMTESSHLDYLIEKGCEIGVSHFILFPAQRSRKQALSSNKIIRLKNILISALKQSRRLYIPKLTILDSINDLADLPNTLYLADPNGKPLLHTPNDDCGFIVGPESGFSKNEIAHFSERLKAKKTSLSKHVLRTETASILSAFLLTQKSS